MAELLQFNPASYTGAANPAAAAAYLATVYKDARFEHTAQLGLGDYEPVILDSATITAKIALADEALQENFRPGDD